MRGRVGKSKGKFQKKSSIARIENIIESAKIYHINRKLKDEHSNRDHSQIYNEIHETGFAAPGRRVVNIEHLAKVSISLIFYWFYMCANHLS